jgi:phage terminase large subunit-like protein
VAEVKDVKSGRAKFILNTGDMVWWGKQGPEPSENPYWKLVYGDVLKQLPAPDRQMRALVWLDAFSPPSAITKSGATRTSKAC